MDFEVRRDDLHECRVAEGATPALGAGQALLEVSSFGLTSNNITYAVFGDAMNYWDFFPAPEGWGRVPVWGFADVAASEVEELAQGARVYGYLPPSSHLVIEPDRFAGGGFVDVSAHRAALPSTYNRYFRTDADPTYDADREGEYMLLKPLYATSFLIDDFLADEGFFGAATAALSSASSKTALSLAFFLSRRDGIEVVGLTSPGNVDFVEATGAYDRVIAYPDIGSLAAEPTVYVDMSGNAEVRASVHGHLADALTHSCVVGATHWDRMAGVPDELPGPRPTFFFAPDRVTKRAAEWGPEGLGERMAADWRPFVSSADGWLRIERGAGVGAIEAAYRELLEGRTDPSVGHVLTPTG